MELTCVEKGLKAQRSEDIKHHFGNSDKIKSSRPCDWCNSYLTILVS